jgi:hypothetical protein
MKITAFLLFGMFSLLGFTAMEHDFHLSKGSLKYKAEQKALQLSMHVFIDDFEEALKNKGVDSMFILTKKENPDADKYIGLYLKENFSVLFDDKKVEMEYLGKELSEDLAGMWVYMEATEIEAPMTATIDYSILMDAFQDQRNILSVQINDKADHLMYSDLERKKQLSWGK